MNDVNSNFDPTADYRVTVKIRNNRLLAAIEASGYTSIPRFAAAFGISYLGLLDLISMKMSPLDSRGRWRLSARQVADALRCLPEDLFNEQQITSPLASNRRDIELTAAQLCDMLPQEHNPYEDALSEQRRKQIAIVLDRLTPRQKKVLMWRFGLGDDEPLTCTEIGKRLNVSKGRANQIERLAIAKLRRWSLLTDTLRDLDTGTNT